MNFAFDDGRTAHAAGVLLAAAGGRLPYLSLVKLLYLADRESLIRTGAPITGDAHYSMDQGPILSRVLDMIRNGDHPAAEWHKVISTSGYSVKLLQEPESWDRLSDFDEELLLEVFTKYGGLDRWELVELTHELPEWTDPGGSRTPVDHEVILREAGIPEDEIRDIAVHADSMKQFRERFAG